MQGKRLGATLRVDLPGPRLRFAGCGGLPAPCGTTSRRTTTPTAPSWSSSPTTAGLPDGTASRNVPAGAPLPGTLARLLAALEVELEPSGHAGPRCLVRRRDSTGGTRTASTRPAARCRAGPWTRSGTAGSTPRWSSAAAASGEASGTVSAGGPARGRSRRPGRAWTPNNWAEQFAARRGSRRTVRPVLDVWARVLAPRCRAAASGRAGRVSCGPPSASRLAGRRPGDGRGRAGRPRRREPRTSASSIAGCRHGAGGSCPPFEAAVSGGRRQGPALAPARRRPVAAGRCRLPGRCSGLRGSAAGAGAAGPDWDRLSSLERCWSNSVGRRRRGRRCSADRAGLDRMVPGQGILRCTRCLGPGRSRRNRATGWPNSCSELVRPRDPLRLGCAGRRPPGSGSNRTPPAGRREAGAAEYSAVHRPAAAIRKTVRQWLPRPGWVRVSSACNGALETGTLQPPRQFYLVALLAVVAPDVDHGLDRVIVVLPVW